MIRIASCVLALLVSTNLAVAAPNGQNPPTRGSQEKNPPTQNHNTFTGIVSGNVPSVSPSGQNPGTRGSEESNPTPQTKSQSAGFTLDKLNGLPRVRYTGSAYQMYYPYYGRYPYYSFNSAYSYPHPYGLGGYYPPRAGGYGGWGWGGWGLGWWW